MVLYKITCIMNGITHICKAGILWHTCFVLRHSMTTGLRCLLEDRREVLLELQHLKILIVLAAERIKYP